MRALFRHALIHHFLEESAQCYPGKVALIHDEKRATYREINEAANQLACWLIKQGVEKGDRVLLIFENSLEYVVSYYGVLKTGAVAVPVSNDIKPEGLKGLLLELDPVLVISSGRFERIIRATDFTKLSIKALVLNTPKFVGHSMSCPTYLWDEIIHEGESFNLDVQIEDSALASIIYTSGSMGQPKGVMLSHKNIVSNTVSICQYLDLSEKDIQMVILPFFYVMGQSLLNTHFAVGGSVVINNKFAFPASVIKQMVDEQVTGFSGVPATYAYLLHRSPLADYRNKLSSLRYCSQAGGHMPMQIKEELRRVLPEHTEIYIMYGATEASARLTYLEPDRLTEKIDSIGRPIPGVSLRIVDTNGLEAPIGKIGEIVANGPNIMKGYWKDDCTTAKVLDGNGYHTGDLGFQDEEGYFYVIGRKDNLMKVGGHRINPQEIEDVLMRSDLIIETAVLGIPDEILGHTLVAVITPKSETCSENNVLSFCAEQLPKYKVPSKAILVRALPKSASGKIDRAKCGELVCARQ
ncbi:MAG: class I adenylate-forming enzyme family protein [Thermodesulfobacteriota bacterium]|nr:class I adenylate-forming enzyme family protein [Thermodesulfobacteriota bacterium]